MQTRRLDPRHRRTILLAGLVSLIAWTASQLFAARPTLEWTPEMLAAAGTMEEAITVIGAERDRVSGPATERDPNRTGLIGPEYGALFTSLGDLAAKRTTTSPDLAALIVYLLGSAGVESGDAVAVGSSGSFPALLVATLAATEAMGIEPVVILSLGASSWGATDPAFDLLGIHQLLLDHGVIVTPPAAVSPGGGRDVGREFEAGLRTRLIDRITASEYPLIREPDLERNVAIRLEAYGLTGGEGQGGRIVSVFINIGGATANLGRSPLVLDLAPGLPRIETLPGPEERGVIHAMAARELPVIHLLHIRGLTQRYHLPWDPMPLPAIGATRFHDARSGNGPSFYLIAALYLIILTGIVVAGRRSAGGQADQA